MDAGDVVGTRIYALPFIIVFFFAYGFAEDAIRKRRPAQQAPQIKPSAVPEISTEAPHVEKDLPAALHGYDYPELSRHDALLHMSQLEKQVAEHERNIQASLAAIQERKRGD